MPDEQTYERAADHVKGIGKSLTGIEGQDVLLVGYEYTSRKMRGEDSDFVMLTIAVDPTKPDETEEYHAWSGPLGEKLQTIDPTRLPMLATFVREGTSTPGYKVWTIR